MDDVTKQMLIAELSIIKSLAAASNGPAGVLNQTTFPVAGPVVNIPSLAMAAVAFKQQSEAIDKLAVLVEKVIKAC